MKLSWTMLVSGMLLSACGGKNQQDSPVRGAIEECQKGCEKAAGCEADTSDDGESCEGSCEEIAEGLAELGCLEKFEVAEKCYNEKPGCDPMTVVCESEYKDVTRCVDDPM